VAVGLIMLIAPVTGCSRGAGAATIAAPVRVQDSDNKDCWWSSAGSDCFSVVWLGPRLEDAATGGFRFVNLVFRDLSGGDSTGMWASVARLDDDVPLMVGNGSIELEVEPANGMTWGEVEQHNDLRVAVCRQP